MANVDEILNKLNNVITSGNESGGNVLNVGILNENALRKLSEAIRGGIRRNQDDNNGRDNNNRQENRRMFLDAMSGYVEKGFKNLGNIVTNTGEQIRSSISSIFKFFPIIGDLFTFTKDLSVKIFDIYQGAYLNVYELHKVGQNLNAGVSSIYEAAGQIGISSEKLIETLTGNSEMVSQLTGVLRSSDLNPMYKYLEFTKEMSKKIGLSFDMTVNMSKDAYKDFAEHLSLTQGNMDALNSKTETYIMFLDKLSKATGKSAESIAKETEARDKEISWRVLSMDPKNKMKIAAMTSIGLSTDEQISWLTGVPNEASTLGSLTPGYAQLAKYVRNYQGNNPEEFMKGIKGIAGEYAPQLGSQISFLQKNSPLAFALSEQYKGMNVVLNANEMSVERMIEQAGLNETLGAMANIEEKWNLFKQKWNKFMMSFSPLFETTIQFFSDTLDGILKLFDDGDEKREPDKTIRIEEGIKKFNETYKEFLSGVSDSILGYVENIKELFETDEWKDPDKLWNTVFKPVADIIVDNLLRMGEYIKDEVLKGLWEGKNKNGKPMEDRGINNLNPYEKNNYYEYVAGTAGLLTPGVGLTGRAVNATRAWNMVDDFGDGDYVDAGEQAFKIAGSMGVTKQIEKTSAGIAMRKAIIKSTGKTAGKFIIKKVPIVGALAGLGFAAKRLWDTWGDEGGADWSGAGLEIASGAASTIPGVGTAVSAGIDAGLAVRDYMKENETHNQNVSEQMKTSLESSQQGIEKQNEHNKNVEESNKKIEGCLDKMCGYMKDTSENTYKMRINTNNVEDNSKVR